MIPIIELIKALILGFTVGISAALIPGPMMFATVVTSFKKGWQAGPSVFIGHAMVEFTIFLLILAGASSFIGKGMISYMAVIGGLAMALFGLVMIKGAKETSTMDVSASVRKLNLSVGPLPAGILTSALNPIFLGWWLTAGSAIVLQEYLAGILAVAAFVAGHWTADLGVLVAVSSSFSRGKELISQRAHEKVLYLCGGLMVAFGLYFLFNYNNVSAMM
ncbi:LysE family transporter [Methanosarcina sp. KYL-1]|uniref:LysE family transporter n=1 Tax=Methanosarcina sp. KYL-1 TaxID=2602068 RepID=UPI00350E4AF6